MDELGYVYNRHAAAMRRSSSQILGLVVTDIRNPYFADLAMAVERSAAEAGYTLMVSYSRDDVAQQNKQLDVMVQQQADGIFLLPAIGSDKEQICRIVDRIGVPVIQLARSVSDAFGYVGPDNLAAGRQLAAHIAELGAGHAVLVGGPEGSSARAERIRGLAAGFDGTGVRFDPAASLPSRNNAEAGAEALTRLLEGGVLPDALITYSDAVALGVYSELRRHGLEPGRDVAVCSFDDIALASLLHPPLTSVATHPEALGARAAQELLAAIAGASRTEGRHLLTPALKVRASTVRWRSRRLPTKGTS